MRNSKEVLEGESFVDVPRVSIQFIGNALEQVKEGTAGAFIVIYNDAEDLYSVFFDAEKYHMDLVEELKRGNLVPGRLAGSGGLKFEGGQMKLINGSSGLREGLREPDVPKHPHKVARLVFKEIKNRLYEDFNITTEEWEFPD